MHGSAKSAYTAVQVAMDYVNIWSLHFKISRLSEFYYIFFLLGKFYLLNYSIYHSMKLQ